MKILSAVLDLLPVAVGKDALDMLERTFITFTPARGKSATREKVEDIEAHLGMR